MAEFAWEARARTGELRRGVMEADNDGTVISRLRAQQLNPVKVKKKPREFSLSIGRGVTDKELVTFVRQFATMINAGLPLVQCLEILGSQMTNKIFAAIVRDVKSQVESGKTFSDSLRRHPKLFDELFVNLVAAGEVGGILDTIMNRLATYIEKRVKLIGQIKAALVYPIGILSVAIIVITVLMIWVIPTFEGMFRDFGAADELPGPTKLVISISNGFVSYFPFLLAAGAGLVAFVIFTKRTRGGKEFYHRLYLNIPVFGDVMRKIAVSRFTRTLGTLLTSGVNILEAMEIVAKGSGNIVVENAIRYARARISEGKNMTEPLAERKIFPSMVVQMIGVGEQTGTLDQMLQKIADFYEEEVDAAVGAMTRMLEPLMMVVIGGIVGFIIVAMYLPIFEIAGKVRAD